MQYDLDHIAFNVTNVDAMLEFYTGILGLEPLRVKAYRAREVAFPSVRVNPSTIIDFFPPHMWQQDRPPETALASYPVTRFNHFCLTIAEEHISEFMHTLEANNIEIIDGPDRRFGARGSGISVYFLDPEQNMVEVRYYPEGE